MNDPPLSAVVAAFFMRCDFHHHLGRRGFLRLNRLDSAQRHHAERYAKGHSGLHQVIEVIMLIIVYALIFSRVPLFRGLLVS